MQFGKSQSNDYHGNKNIFEDLADAVIGGTSAFLLQDVRLSERAFTTLYKTAYCY